MVKLRIRLDSDILGGYKRVITLSTKNMKATPKDFFLNLLSSLALYYCAGWLVSLLYDYINFEFGRRSYGYGAEFFSGSMRWAIASLVIVFPVYILVTRALNKDLDAHPEKKELRVRKWLMYLTLSLASIALVVDLVALIYQFLSGEFATAFFLKVLSVALVAGMVFTYYFYELRREAGKSAPNRLVFRYGAIAFVAIAVIGGFFIVGSPKTAREMQYDNQRVSDLQGIQWQIVSYWQNKGRLPANLDEVADPISSYLVPVDPESGEGKKYEYAVKGAQTFELCATFSHPIAKDPSMAKPTMYFEGDPQIQNWAHEAGRTCFERTIDADRYPITKK